MRRTLSIALIALVLTGAATARAEEVQGLSLSIAQPAAAAKLTATGRLQATLCARISPRVAGHLIAFGKIAEARNVDAGVMVAQGQVLFQLDDTTYKNLEAAAQALLASAQASLASLTAPTRPEKIEAFKDVIAELDARIADRQHDEERYQRLVEVDKTAPAKRLEEVRTDLLALAAQRGAAAARLDEAVHGPTKEEIAVAEARVREAQVALKSTQDDLRDTTVRAPYDGLVTRRFKSAGDYVAVNPPTEVLELVNTEALEAEFCLPEAYFTQIQAGRTLLRLSSPLLKTPLDLTIARVVGDIDPAKGTFAIRVALPAAQNSGLLPGAFVTAVIDLNRAAEAVIVPARAIRSADGKDTVFVLVQGKLAQRRVELGDKLTEGVLVKSGLQAGDNVVLGPAAGLKDGAAAPSYLLPKAP